MPSIRHVAAIAGVSIKTVSRVVNKVPNVSAELRDGSWRRSGAPPPASLKVPFRKLPE